MDERIVRATATDDHVNRAYQRAGSAEVVGLFVGYGVRLRDLAPHRPEVCYPGAGWTLDETRLVELNAVDGSVVPCQIHRFHKGGLADQRIIVLNYYLVDGRPCPDVSLLRSKLWRPARESRYAAQVQVTTTGSPYQELRDDGVRQFVADWAPVIRRLIEGAVAQATGVRRGTARGG